MALLSSSATVFTFKLSSDLCRGCLLEREQPRVRATYGTRWHSPKVPKKADGLHFPASSNRFSSSYNSGCRSFVSIQTSTVRRRSRRRVGVVNGQLQAPERGLESPDEGRNQVGHKTAEPPSQGLFGSLNDRVVKDFKRLVATVNEWEPFMERLTHDELAGKTVEFKGRLAQGETLEDIQAEAFAVVREAAKRTVGMRHFDVQILGGAVLHSGAIAEMKTGEGKTLVSTLPAYLNALPGKGCHVVTVNDYLAKRDAEWMGTIHRFLGLSVGLIQADMRGPERVAAYTADITYAANNEVGFDYLRDHTARRKQDLILNWPEPFWCAIIDEVDSVLIDEGRNPLIISAQDRERTGDRFRVAAEIADLLEPDTHYVLDLKHKSLELTDSGVEVAELTLAAPGHPETKPSLWAEADSWAKYIVTALKAKHFYVLNQDYIVRDGQVQIIDEFTGRIMTSRRWQEGVHQAVEAKEHLEKISPVMESVAQITYQSLFRLYPKLCGMTGTAKTEDKEFLNTYNIAVVSVPPNRLNQRVDLGTVLFMSKEAKHQRVLLEVLEMHKRGRPVLVGTTTVEESEELSWRMKELALPHSVLNAKPEYVAREAEIVAQAGRHRAITIATNMAGRGTDIILGGNPKMLAMSILEWHMAEYVRGLLPLGMERGPCPPNEVAGLTKIQLDAATLGTLMRTKAAWSAVYGRKCAPEVARAIIERAQDCARSSSLHHLRASLQDAREGAELVEVEPLLALALKSIQRDCGDACRAEGQLVKAAGGLHVVGTALNDSRRIDNQLRGRAGRQGDPGSTQFFISLDDKVFAQHLEWVRELAAMMGFVDASDGFEGAAIAAQISQLQVLRENNDAAIRKHELEYDAVLQVQRVRIYNLRRAMLDEPPRAAHARALRYIQAAVDALVSQFCDAAQPVERWDLEALLKGLRDIAMDAKLVRFRDEQKTNVRFTGEPLAKVTADDLLGALQDMPALEGRGLWRRALGAGSPPLELPLSALQATSHGLVASVESLKRWNDIVADLASLEGKYKVQQAVLRATLGGHMIDHFELGAPKIPLYRQAELERMIMLTALDRHWQQHLKSMTALRLAVSVRQYGRLDPLEEYKIESSRYFINMLESMQYSMVNRLLSQICAPHSA